MPVIVFTKGGGLWLDEIAACGADVVGLDWTVNLGQARAAWAARWRCKATWTPTCCSRPPEARWRAKPWPCWTAFGRPQRADGGWDGHVFNLGHGISQHTPPEHVARPWSRRCTPIRGPGVQRADRSRSRLLFLHG
jgi:uroporphyrinogen decarboxylase